MKCARCGVSRATNRWELTACADGGKRRSKYLCDEHDAELNEIAMKFLGVSGATEKAAAYRAAREVLSAAPTPQKGVDGGDAQARVDELIAADREYDEANRDWEHCTNHDPSEFSEETWRRVADRFEAAVMRRLRALDAIAPRSSDAWEAPR